MSTELNDLRLQLERLQYDNKEGTIMLDSVKEQNTELTAEIEELRVRDLTIVFLRPLSLCYLSAEDHQRAQGLSARSHPGGQGQEKGREDGCSHGQL